MVSYRSPFSSDWNESFYPEWQQQSETSANSTNQSASSSAGISWGEATAIGAYALSQVLQGIASYQAAKKNLSTLRQNYASATDALETNINNVIRVQNRQREGENRVQIGASGIKADSFADVMQSNKVIEENDIAVMRANLRNQMYADIRRGIKDKYKAKDRAIAGAVGTAVGAAAGIATGNPQAAIMLTQAGGSIGQSLGG